MADEEPDWAPYHSEPAYRDEQRNLGGSDQPLASHTALDILRAKLSGGDLEGLYVKVDGVWVDAEDLIYRGTKVMRNGQWVDPTPDDLAKVILRMAGR